MTPSKHHRVIFLTTFLFSIASSHTAKGELILPTWVSTPQYAYDHKLAYKGKELVGKHFLLIPVQSSTKHRTDPRTVISFDHTSIIERGVTITRRIPIIYEDMHFKFDTQYIRKPERLAQTTFYIGKNEYNKLQLIRPSKSFNIGLLKGANRNHLAADLRELSEKEAEQFFSYLKKQQSIERDRPNNEEKPLSYIDTSTFAGGELIHKAYYGQIDSRSIPLLIRDFHQQYSMLYAESAENNKALGDGWSAVKEVVTTTNGFGNEIDRSEGRRYIIKTKHLQSYNYAKGAITRNMAGALFRKDGGASLIHSMQPPRLAVSGFIKTYMKRSPATLDYFADNLHRALAKQQVNVIKSTHQPHEFYSYNDRRRLPWEPETKQVRQGDKGHGVSWILPGEYVTKRPKFSTNGRYFSIAEFVNGRKSTGYFSVDKDNDINKLSFFKKTGTPKASSLADAGVQEMIIDHKKAYYQNLEKSFSVLIQDDNQIWIMRFIIQDTKDPKVKTKIMELVKSLKFSKANDQELLARETMLKYNERVRAIKSDIQSASNRLLFLESISGKYNNQWEVTSNKQRIKAAELKLTGLKNRLSDLTNNLDENSDWEVTKQRLSEDDKVYYINLIKYKYERRKADILENISSHENRVLYYQNSINENNNFKKTSPRLTKMLDDRIRHCQEQISYHRSIITEAKIELSHLIKNPPNSFEDSTQLDNAPSPARGRRGLPARGRRGSPSDSSR